MNMDSPIFKITTFNASELGLFSTETRNSFESEKMKLLKLNYKYTLIREETMDYFNSTQPLLHEDHVTNQPCKQISDCTELLDKYV